MPQSQRRCPTSSRQQAVRAAPARGQGGWRRLLFPRQSRLVHQPDLILNLHRILPPWMLHRLHLPVHQQSEHLLRPLRPLPPAGLCIGWLPYLSLWWIPVAELYWEFPQPLSRPQLHLRVFR